MTVSVFIICDIVTMIVRVFYCMYVRRPIMCVYESVLMQMSMVPDQRISHNKR